MESKKILQLRYAGTPGGLMEYLAGIAIRIGVPPISPYFELTLGLDEM